MSVATSRVNVATIATVLATAGVNGMEVAVRNAGAASIYIGPAAVTTANGFEVEPGSTWNGRLRGYDAIYGIVAAATETAHVIELK